MRATRLVSRRFPTLSPFHDFWRGEIGHRLYWHMLPLALERQAAAALMGSGEIVRAWDEDAGRVSRAFDEWLLIDRDQRHFLHLGLAYIGEALERLWDAVASAPAGEDGPELPEAYERHAGGLYPQDFQWMHCAGVVKDAVTNFEVYLEEAREEVLRHHGEPVAVTDDAPYWRGDLQPFYKRMGVSLPSPDVNEVRALRHLLTHRRGELRTKAARERFAPGAHVLDAELTLDEPTVIRLMDTLADEVRSIDARVYDHVYGGQRLAAE